MRTRMVFGITLFLMAFVGRTTSGSVSSLVTLHWARDRVQLLPNGDGDLTVKLRGAVSCANPGSPDLPWCTVQVPLPAGERLESFHWTPGPSEKLAEHCRPVPAVLEQPNDGGSPAEPRPDPAIYSGGSPYPSECVLYNGSQSGSGRAVALLRICPFRWNPVDGSLWFTPDGTLQITFAPDTEPGRFLPAPRSLSAGPVLDSRTPPWAAPAPAYHLRGGLSVTSRPSTDSTPVEFLIVTDTTLVSVFDSLAAWKNQSGHPAVVRTVQWIEANYPQGVDVQERIRLFLRDAYRYWGTRTVIMGGDTKLVPARTARCYVYQPESYGRDITTDYYYACLDGNWNANGNNLYGEDPVIIQGVHIASDFPDLVPELKVGRVLGAHPAEVSAYLAKYWRYVKNPPVGFGYLDKILDMGEVLFDADWVLGDPDTCCCPHPNLPCPSTDGAQYCFQMMDSVQASPAGSFFSFDELYERSAHWNPHGHDSRLLGHDTCVNSINDGRNVIFHSGHGGPDHWDVGTGQLFISDVQALTNGSSGHWTGLTYSVNNSAAAIDGDCLARAWVTAPNGGGLILVGSSNLDFPSTSLEIQNSFLHSWLRSDATPGVAFYAAKDSMAERIGQSRTAGRFLLFSLILLGDPDMNVWKTDPLSPTVTPSADLNSFALGSGPVTITVKVGHAPLPGARVCMYKVADALAADTTDAQGNCVLPFAPTSAGPFLLTVTGPTIRAYQLQGTVVRPALVSFVSMDNYSVLDDRTHCTVGNGDGVIEIGETVGLSLTVSNHGNAPAADVTGRLALQPGKLPGNLLVDFPEDSVSLGTLAPGAVRSIPGAFRLRVEEPIRPVDGDSLKRIVLPLRITFSALDGDHSQNLSPLAVRPDLVLTHTPLWETTAIGPPDSIPNNGETMAMQVRLFNPGPGIWSNLKARLLPVGGSISFAAPTDSIAMFPPIAAGSSALCDTLRFMVNVANNLQVTLVVRDTLRTNQKVVLNPTLLLAYRPNPYPGAGVHIAGRTDAIQVYWDPPANEQHLWGFHLAHSSRLAGPFTPLGVGFTRGVRSFLDENLSPLTPYYYRVASVDSSGIEGRWSAAVMGSTAPGPAPGWEGGNALGLSVDVGPNINDLNGSSSYDVLCSSDNLYCFKGDGSEYYDGDGNPSTRGVLTPSSIGIDFYCKSAVYDSSGVKRIIAISSGTSGSNSFSARLQCLDYLGRVVWSQPITNRPVLSAPAIGDIDGDGTPEIVFLAGTGVYAFDADGTPFQGKPGGLLKTLAPDSLYGGYVDYQYGSVALAHLDDNALGNDIVFTQEDVAGTGGGNPSKLWVIHGKDIHGGIGTNAPGFPFSYSSVVGVAGQLSFSSPAIGDICSRNLNGTVGPPDGRPDIVIETSTYIWAFDPWAAGNNKLAWCRQIAGRSTGREETPLTSSPALGDIDGDRRLDIAVGGALGRVYVFHGDGTPFAGFRDIPNDPNSIYKTAGSPSALMGSPILAHLDDYDRHPDVIIGDNNGFVYAFHADGTTVAGFPYSIPGAAIGEGLAAGDINQSGTQKLIIQPLLAQNVQALDFIRSAGTPEDVLLNPWPMFRHDSRNTGSGETPLVPTAVETVPLRCQPAEGLSADLRWRTTTIWRDFILQRRSDASTEWQEVGRWQPSRIQEGPDAFHTVDAVPEAGTWHYRLLGQRSGEGSNVIGNADVTLDPKPMVFRLHPALPNPSSPNTRIQCDLPQTGWCEILIADLAGRTVRKLFAGTAKAGVLRLDWDGTNDHGRPVGSGLYFVAARAPGQGRQVEKVVVMR